MRSGEKQGMEENGAVLVLSGCGRSAAGWEVGQKVGVSRRGTGSSRPCRGSGAFSQCSATSRLFIWLTLLLAVPLPRHHRARGEHPAMMRRGPARSIALEHDARNSQMETSTQVLTDS